MTATIRKITLNAVFMTGSRKASCKYSIFKELNSKRWLRLLLQALIETEQFNFLTDAIDQWLRLLLQALIETREDTPI